MTNDNNVQDQTNTFACIFHHFSLSIYFSPSGYKTRMYRSRLTTQGSDILGRQKLE